MGCNAKIDKVHLRNTWKSSRYQEKIYFFERRMFLIILIISSATKKWKVKVGPTASGPWTKIGVGEFPDPRPDPNNIPLYDLTPYGYNIPLTYQVSLMHLVLNNYINFSHSLSSSNVKHTGDHMVVVFSSLD